MENLFAIVTLNNDDNFSLIQFVLGEFAVEATRVNTLAGFFTLVQSRNPDLLVFDRTDQLSDGNDGAELVDRIGRDASFDSIPKIIIEDNEDQLISLCYMVAGPILPLSNTFSITKPLDIDRLRNVLAEIF